MIVSRSRRVLFVHVQRTGGTTLSDLLRAQLPDAAQLGGQHASVSDAAALLGEEVGGYFKFAFVRNPWERILSWWMVLRQARGAVQTAVPAELGAYLRGCVEITGREGPKPFPAEQWTLIGAPEGEVLVDELGRYECYEADVRRIFARFGRSPGDVPRSNVTRHGHYRTYYDGDARHLVELLYPRDTARLGYAF